jgi:molybdopterin-binding protein
MKVKTTILEIEKPTVNGRIYGEEVAQKIVESINSKQVLLVYLADGSYPPSLNNAVAHAVSGEIVSGSVIAEIEILNTPKGKLLQELFNVGNISIKTMGVGRIFKNCVDDDYELTGLLVDFEDQ